MKGVFGDFTEEEIDKSMKINEENKKKKNKKKKL